MADVTAGGGVTYSGINGSVAPIIGDAIQRQFGATTTTGAPRYSGSDSTTGSVGTPGMWTVADITTGPQSYTAGALIDAIVDTSTGNDTLVGGAQTQVILGNNADDDITMTRGGVVLTGTGDDTVNLDSATLAPTADKIVSNGSGPGEINLGAGVDTVNLYGADDTINLTDPSVVNLRTASDVTVNGGAGVSKVSGSGNDTITVGTAPLTITDKGSATVYGAGATGGFTFKGGSGDDSVVAGSGATTLYGGSGKEYFQGGSGSLKFLAGSGNNTVVAGTGSESFYGGGKAASNAYVFDNQGAGQGGSVSIYGFVSGRDQIQLGSGESTVTSHAISGGWQLTLTDGTTVTLVGFHSNPI